MYLCTLLLNLISLLASHSEAVPDLATIQERGRLILDILYFTTDYLRAAYLATCASDNLYRSFVDPRYSSSASAFCSTYIRTTVSATKTTT